MSLTNKHGLPDIFVEAVDIFKGDYDPEGSDYTATGLILPVRIASLLHKHRPELEEDVSDRVWALSGQIGHLLFQRIAEKHPKRYLAEKRYHCEVNAFKVSARVDCYDLEEETLWDYKETSVWKFVLGDTKDWEAQLNVGNYCFRMNGGNPKKLRILCKLTDWKRREAAKKADYPQMAVHIVDIPLWPDRKTRHYILDRIAENERNFDNPPVCTPEERWQREGKYAVMKRGRKTAVKLFPSFDEAYLAANVWGVDKHYVESRETEPIRCLYYCPVKQFCSFYKELIGTKPPSLRKDPEAEDLGVQDMKEFV